MGIARRVIGYLSSRQRVVLVISLVVLACITGYFVYSEYRFAEELNRDVMKHVKQGAMEGYVSDEIWYVDASRNILHKVFGVDPTSPCGECYTVFFSGNATEVPGIIEDAARDTGVVIKDRYVAYDGTPFMFIYVDANNGSIEEFVRELRERGVPPRDYVRGWIYGKAKDIDLYLNVEHPPVAKYAIASSMILLGDKPFNWRIPSIIAAALVILLSYAVTYRILRIRYGEAVSSIIALVPPILLSQDPILKCMGAIALLDVYVAASTLAALYVLVSARGRLAKAVSVVAASTLKFPALFLGLMHAVEELAGEKRGLVDRVFKLLQLLALYALLFIAIQALVSIPLISYLGFTSWFNQAIPGAFRWHTSIKHSLTAGPTVSTPLDWVLGRRWFTLYIWTNGDALLAKGNSLLYLASLVLAVILIPLAVSDRAYRKAWLGLMSVYGGYVILWIIGGRTQYSYYVVQVAPLFYINIAVAAARVVPREFIRLYIDGVGSIARMLSIERHAEGADADAVIAVSIALALIGVSAMIHAPWSEPSIYSDVASLYWIVYGSPERWYGPQETYGVPYLDYRFDMMPGYAWVFLVTTMTRLVLGYDKYLGIDKGFYAYYLLNTLIAGVAAASAAFDMHAVSRRFTGGRRAPAYLYLVLPSIIVYGVYSWDIIALAALARSLRRFIEGDTRSAGFWAGVAFLFNPIYIIVVLAYSEILRQEARGLLAWFLATIVGGHALALLRPGTLLSLYAGFFSHYMEGSWLVLVARSPSDEVFIQAAWVAAFAAGSLAAILPLRDRGSPLHAYGRIVSALSIAFFLSPVYKPQYNLVIASLWLPALDIAYLPMLVIQDMAASTVILTWFSSNPADPYSVPQLANYVKAFLLLAILLYNMGKYVRAPGPLKSIASRITSPLRRWGRLPAGEPTVQCSPVEDSTLSNVGMHHQ